VKSPKNYGNKLAHRKYIKYHQISIKKHHNGFWGFNNIYITPARCSIFIYGKKNLRFLVICEVNHGAYGPFKGPFMNHLGMIPRLLTMIPGLGRSEVVIIYPLVNEQFAIENGHRNSVVPLKNVDFRVRYLWRITIFNG